MKKLRTRTTTRYAIANRPRKWRRPVPCPVCGGKDIRFHTFGKELDRIDLLGLPYWFVTCPGCLRAVVIDTNHADPKEAVRAWNHIANNHPKAKD